MNFVDFLVYEKKDRSFPRYFIKQIKKVEI
jgi:hypothetical protein